MPIENPVSYFVDVQANSKVYMKGKKPRIANTMSKNSIRTLTLSGLRPYHAFLYRNQDSEVLAKD